jgi:hypothetical protein
MLFLRLVLCSKPIDHNDTPIGPVLKDNGVRDMSCYIIGLFRF